MHLISSRIWLDSMSSQTPAPGARPSVLFLVAKPANRIGSVEAFVVELARQLNKEGWNLTVCFEDSPSPLVKSFLLAPGNVSVDAMPGQEGMGLSNVKEFLRLRRKYRPKVLMYHLGGVVRWWPLLGKLVGVRRSVYWDASSRTARNYDYRASKRVRAIMGALSEAVCGSQFIKTCSDREGIIPRKKSRVIFCSVDNERSLGDGDAFRQHYGIPRDRIVVMKISWLVPEKGIDLALRAAKRALNVRDDLHFVFCGDGENRKEYEVLAGQLEIADHVTWTGQIEDLPAMGAFRAADIQIQCSQWHEAFCLAVGEGMSASLPVVASRIGGLPELVEDGVNGFLFDPASDEELATAILTLAADSELRARMGARGRKRAIEDYDVVRNTKRWVDVLLDREDAGHS